MPWLIIVFLLDYVGRVDENGVDVLCKNGEVGD